MDSAALRSRRNPAKAREWKTREPTLRQNFTRGDLA
jgi:hypothetical protein